jgi:hypothetical protein
MYILKQRGGKVVLILVLYLHALLCAGERKEVEWASKKIEEKVKIVKLGKLKKHLGIMYDWKQDKFGKYVSRSFYAKDDRRN